jgi:hypothetical protein
MIIQFPFIAVPQELRKIVGEPTPGTRIYRREGTLAECGLWFETLGEHYKGDVGLSPAGASMFVPVTRAAVHKRMREGKLTGFTFYVTRQEKSFLGFNRKAKGRPYIVISVSECKAWAVEMKYRAGLTDEAGLKEIQERLKREAAKEEPASEKEAREAIDFVDTDPKDKGKRHVKYEEPLNREDRQQDMYYLVAEALAGLLSGKKAELHRKRLEKGLEWDKKNKAWKWKEQR